ncbi:MAG: hypothetical protein HGB06_03905 [Chlorobaculum sp.]|jgi:hypothetical protein|nr:hypothetical protein [Chlorobaculum sp.]
MRSGILNKRKEWLDNSASESLAVWATKADELQGYSDTLKYFGIKQIGNVYEINPSIKVPYFQQSLDLFKIVMQKQIAKEDIGLPSLDEFPEYDALITIVGFSPAPIMHTILALAPKKVYPVATEETARNFYKVPLNPITKKPDGKVEYFASIIRLYKEPQQTIIAEAIGRNVASIGSMDTFKRVREIIHDVRKDNRDAKIAIDITGGKKSADVSAFLIAAIEQNIDIYYVDFEDHNGIKACCGTEFLNKLDNPYDIYNITEESLIKSLWERQDFEAVAVVADEAIEKLTEEKAKKYDLEKERARLNQIKTAAKCYSDWARFNYSQALDSVFDYYKRKHDDILSKLSDCKNIRKDAYGAILLSLDRWTRGVDALGLCDLDKSALCFTQAIEVLCEYRLYDMAVKGSVSPQFNIGTIHFDVSSLIKFLWDSEKQNMVINQLESRQNVTYVWNEMMRFDKKIKPSSGKLIEKLSIRNKLAHFNCYDKEKDAKNMAKVKELKDTVRLLIEYFILIYQNEEKLKEKTFDVLQAPFNFAKYSDFD